MIWECRLDGLDMQLAGFNRYHPETACSEGFTKRARVLLSQPSAEAEVGGCGKRMGAGLELGLVDDSYCVGLLSVPCYARNTAHHSSSKL